MARIVASIVTGLALIGGMLAGLVTNAPSAGAYELSTIGGFSVPAHGVIVWLSTGDMNNDGRPDIVVIYTDGTGKPHASTLINNGGNAFTRLDSPAQFGPDFSNVSLTDVDGDGHLDLVMKHPTNGDVDILFGSASGVLGKDVLFGIGGDGGAALVLSGLLVTVDSFGMIDEPDPNSGSVSSNTGSTCTFATDAAGQCEQRLEPFDSYAYGAATIFPSTAFSNSFLIGFGDDDHSGAAVAGSLGSCTGPCAGTPSPVHDVLDQPGQGLSNNEFFGAQSLQFPSAYPGTLGGVAVLAFSNSKNSWVLDTFSVEDPRDCQCLSNSFFTFRAEKVLPFSPGLGNVADAASTLAYTTDLNGKPVVWLTDGTHTYSYGIGSDATATLTRTYGAGGEAIATADFLQDGDPEVITGTTSIVLISQIGKPDRTKTTLSCSNTHDLTGVADQCTATVTDVSSGPTTPTGTVHFTTSGPGGSSTFPNGNPTCTLAPGKTAGTASCALNYTPHTAGKLQGRTDNLSASYAGDASHLVSSGVTSVAVVDLGH